MERCPVYHTPMPDETKMAYEKAMDLFAAGKREEAKEALLSLTRAHPDFYDAYESLGMMYYKEGALDPAIEWTEKLAALRPEYAMAHTNLSIFYMKRGSQNTIFRQRMMNVPPSRR